MKLEGAEHEREVALRRELQRYIALTTIMVLSSMIVLFIRGYDGYHPN